MKFAFLSRHRVADGLWRRGRNGHLSHTCEGVGVGVGVGEGEGEVGGRGGEDEGESEGESWVKGLG